MPTTQDSIDHVHPSDGATGVPLNNTVQIIFDTEIDEWSIENGGFILEGLDTDEVIHPGYSPTTLIQGEEQQILQSPGLRSIVPGVFSFQRVALLDTTLVSTQDTAGAGNLYRTKLTFTPSSQMAAIHNYTVYLVGDEDLTDTEKFGLRSRSVFDGVDNVGNTGSGELTFSGTYTGNLSQDTINVKITKAGVVGVAEYEVWRDSSPINLEGPFLTSLSENELLDGVRVRFESGSFEVDDEFSVVVKRPVFLEGTTVFSFTTGGGSITSVPLGTSTSITGDPIITQVTTFEVLSTSPEDFDSNLTLSDAKRIVITMSKEIDPTSVTADMIQVLAEPVIDHPLLTTSVKTGPISNTITVSGTKIYIDL